jgi:hypothetical protein
MCGRPVLSKTETICALPKIMLMFGYVLVGKFKNKILYILNLSFEIPELVTATRCKNAHVICMVQIT